MVSTRAKDCYKFLTTVDSFTDGQVKISDWDSDFLSWILLDVVPSGGPYHGAKFKFKVRIGRDFPNRAPGLTCITPIYHPNIDPTSEGNNVCLSLFDEWESTFGLVDCVQGILFLFYHPNVEDPLSPYFDGEGDEEEFYKYVRLSLTGRDAEDFSGPRLIEDDEEIRRFLEEDTKENSQMECVEGPCENEATSNGAIPIANPQETENTEMEGATMEIPLDSFEEKISQDNETMNNKVLDTCNGTDSQTTECTSVEANTKMEILKIGVASCSENEKAIPNESLNSPEMNGAVFVQAETDMELEGKEGLNPPGEIIPYNNNETVTSSEALVETKEGNAVKNEECTTKDENVSNTPTPSQRAPEKEMEIRADHIQCTSINASSGDKTEDIKGTDIKLSSSDKMPPSGSDMGALAMDNVIVCAGKMENQNDTRAELELEILCEFKSSEAIRNAILNLENKEQSLTVSDDDTSCCDIQVTSEPLQVQPSRANEETGQIDEHLQSNEDEEQPEPNAPGMNEELSRENTGDGNEKTVPLEESFDIDKMVEKVQEMMEFDPKYERERRPSDSDYDEFDEFDEDEVEDEENDDQTEMMDETPMFQDKSTQTDTIIWNDDFGQYITRFKTIAFVSADYDNALMFFGASVLYVINSLLAMADPESF